MIVVVSCGDLSLYVFKRLKIPRPRGCAGSIPASGTRLKNDTVQHSTKASDKSGAFVFLLSRLVRSGIPKSGSLGGMSGGICPAKEMDTPKQEEKPCQKGLCHSLIFK